MKKLEVNTIQSKILNVKTGTNVSIGSNSTILPVNMTDNVIILQVL